MKKSNISAALISVIATVILVILWRVNPDNSHSNVHSIYPDNLSSLLYVIFIYFLTLYFTITFVYYLHYYSTQSSLT